MTDITMETLQPTGQDSQIPREPILFARTIARTTLRMRSVNVPAINCFISPTPLRIPSATNLTDEDVIKILVVIYSGLLLMKLIIEIIQKFIITSVTNAVRRLKNMN